MDMSSTITSNATAATSSMGMSMGPSSQCKISMLWNWYTVDACFLSSTWRITSHGMFAGSCIGVIFLVLSLEFLRRLGKEYDRFLARQYSQHQQQQQQQQQQSSHARNSDASEEPLDGCINAPDPKHSQQHQTRPIIARRADDLSAGSWSDHLVSRPSKPNIKQQLIRALLHMLQFSVAYFIMLLAMYYNGYIIICILIGAFLGAFIFSWGEIGVDEGPYEDPTVCCG